MSMSRDVALGVAVRVVGAKWIALGAIFAMFVGLIGIMVIGGAASEPPRDAQSVNCEGSWTGDSPGDRNLNSSQLDNAATIYQVAMETGMGERAATIAIATSLQESDLGLAASSHVLNSDGDVGPFQQRAYVGWYADGNTIEENIGIISDTAYAARTFLLGHTVGVSSSDGNPVGYHIPGLTNIDGWQGMSLSAAAQKVQVSAFPDAYAKHEALASSLIGMITNGDAGTIICGPGGPVGDCPIFDGAIEVGLTPDALRVLRCAKKQWPQLASFSVFRGGDPQDHGAGKAIDLMIPSWEGTTGINLGTEIAEWFQANVQEFGITYIIWRKHIWSSGRASEGWRECGVQATCYSGPNPTAAHMDHVHVSVQGNAGFSNASAPNQADNPAGSSSTVAPLAAGTYRVGSAYGRRFHPVDKRWKTHTGLDLVAASGTPIKAVRAGTVSFASWNSAFGWLVKIDHGGGLSTWYAHMRSSPSVSTAQRINAGDSLGSVGTTGKSTGPHLHIEVRSNGVHQDPKPWFVTQGVVL